MSTYEQINTLLREKLPHLQELSFGCVVRHKTNHIDWTVASVDTNKLGSRFLLVDVKNYTFDYYSTTELLRIFKILGHPIQINDWLGLLGGEYSINGNGAVGGWYSKSKQPVIYNLSKPFDSQSELFYEWLLAELT